MHQFDKVEMFSFVEPDAQRRASTSGCWRSRRRSCRELEIPYRVVNIAVDDLGASAAKKYDIEAWLPGPGALPRADVDLEHDRLPGAAPGDPHARREGGKPETLHTLNGTAVAVGRTIIALLENGQREDGSVALPEVLVPYGAPAELPPAGLTRARHAAGRLGEDVERLVEARDLETAAGRSGSRRRAPSGPARRSTWRSPLSSTLSPVESMNSTAAEVEHDRRVALVDRLRQALGEARRRRHVDLAAHVDDVRARRRSARSESSKCGMTGDTQPSDSARGSVSMRQSSSDRGDRDVYDHAVAAKTTTS